MPPSQGPVKELDEKFIDLIGNYVADIKNGKVTGSNNEALSMLTLLETIINESEHATAFELCVAVREAGRRVRDALPHALCAANVTRRVLRAIRDETRATHTQCDASGVSLQRLVCARRGTVGASGARDVRAPLRDHIAELRVEVTSSLSAICDAALSHVHADELILTCGASALVERFLRAAAQRRYRLIACEGGDAGEVGEVHAMCARLSACGVRVTVACAAATHALVSRVNKVVVAARAALGGGAALLTPGARAATLAAKMYNVPVLVLAPLYALCPLHAADAVPAAPAAPHNAITYDHVESVKAQVYSSRYDVIPPDHITLFITNLGGSSPSYMYRLLSELYDTNDYTL